MLHVKHLYIHPVLGFYTGLYMHTVVDKSVDKSWRGPMESRGGGPRGEKETDSDTHNHFPSDLRPLNAKTKRL